MRVNPPKKGTPLSDEQRRYRVAIHEAGHAVMAYYLGAWVSHEGATIHDQEAGLCNTRHCRRFWTLEKEAIFSFAGWLSEWRWERRASSRTVDSWLTPIMGAEQELEAQPKTDLTGDFVPMVRQVREAKPHFGLLEKARYIGSLYTYTRKLISIKDVWRAIVAVADELYDRGTLSGEDVEAAVMNEFKATIEKVHEKAKAKLARLLARAPAATRVDNGAVNLIEHLGPRVEVKYPEFLNRFMQSAGMAQMDRVNEYGQTMAAGRS